MSSKLDLDDIEQMCADILKESPPDILDGFEDKFEGKEAVHTEQHPKLDSETPTPAEPLEFVASPIEETAKVLQTASRATSRSTSRSRSTSATNLRRKSSTVEDLAIDMPQELRQALESPISSHQVPELTISTPTRRSSARLERLAKEGTHDEIKRERDSTSLGVLSPNTSKDPESALVEAIRRASSHARASTTSAVMDSPGPSKPPLHRRVSSNVLEESNEVSVRPMINRSTSSQRTQSLELLAHTGDPEAIKRERDSTSLGVLSPNRALDPEQAIEQAVRRASSSTGRPSGKGRRPSEAMESLARNGTTAEIRAERESTSQGILRPNLETSAEDSMASAIRRASQSKDRPASIAAARRRSSRLESFSKSPISEPKKKFSKSSSSFGHRNPDSPVVPRGRRPSQAMEELSRNGTAAEIRAERESTSSGILRPNLEADPEDAIAMAYRRASSSAGRRPSSFGHKSPSTPSTHKRTASQELEAIANKGSPAQIRAERESTSQGVPDPSVAINPEKSIERAVRRASDASENNAGISRSDSLSRSRSSDVSETSISEVKEALGRSPSHKHSHSSSIEPSVPPIVEIPEKEVGSLDIVEEAPVPPKNTTVNSPKRNIDIPVSPDVGFNEDMDILASPENTRVPEIDPKDPTPAGSAVVSEDEGEINPTDKRPAAEGKLAAPVEVAERTSPKSCSTVDVSAAADADAAASSKPDHEIVYLYISMASGGRGAMQNFQKAQTILQSYNVEFTPVEVSMDERARRIWKYRGLAKNKKLPAVVRDGEIKLDFEELLAANENEEVDEIIFEEF